ncbi:NAD-dependent epimerase/dehydratase family protein, partial [Vibrio anguillarum]
ALNGVDCVVHCAARVHQMQDSAQDALTLYRDVNTAGTLNLARQAVEAGVKRFIFISSIKVNGEYSKPDQPFLPETSFIPDDPYGLSKYEAEQ